MKDLFHHSTSSASRCYNHIQPWLLLCNAEKWAASIMCRQPHLVARKGTAVCPVWGETCRTRLLSAASLCLSCAEDSVFVSEEMFSCSASMFTSTDGPSVPLWTGSDAGDDSLPGDLPDRPGDDGHCYEGLHWGPTLHMFSYCHKFFVFFHLPWQVFIYVISCFWSPFSGWSDQLWEEKKGEFNFIACLIGSNDLKA